MERLHGFLTVLILIYFNKCCGFNLDLNFVDVIDIGSSDKYFGYSVLLQKGSPSSVLVGAPKSNSSHPNHRNIKEPGALYRCEIGTSNSCRQYVIDSEGNTVFRDGDSRYNYKNRKDGGLLGATVDGGENVGDPAFVCSPRWINDRTDRNGQHFLPNGMCYKLRDTRILDEAGEKLMPLLHSGKQGYTTPDYVVKYYYAMGEVGMSMQYLDKEKELLLGAPGVLSWKGSVVRYKTLNSNYLPQQQRLVQSRTKRQVNSAVNVPNPVHISSLKEENSYFGYAISSGIFNPRFRNLWYVAGAPRAEELYGLVLLYEFSQYDDLDLMVHKKLVGDQLGAYFGAALLSVDVTGNGVADLLVGAPTYFTEAFDEGCVYFYRNTGQGNFENALKLFGSKHPGARFGTTISSIGDINRDSYQDVAISAPYEKEKGTVYIYLGSKNGISTEFNQRIVAEEINTSLRGFGFSISKGVDIDQNFYNDIAIGAYKSGQVAIVKSRPVIKYSAKLTPSMRELSVEATNFNVTYCIFYETSTNNVNNVDTVIKIVKDSRAIGNNIMQTVTLTKNKNFCDDLRIMLKSGSYDYTKPFTVEMSYAVTELPQTAFCSSCPVTNPADIKSVTLNIPFANGCGTDNICQPNLKISANFENNMNSLVIGLLTTIKLKLRVENTGEPAYLCQVHMMLPFDVEIVRIPSKCQLSDDRIYHCLIDNVLQPKAYKDLVFDLDIKKLSPKDTQLSLNLTVDSKGEEVSLEDNSLILTLNLQLENNMEIQGKSFPDQMVYVDEENKIKSEIVKFDQKFIIQNSGPSPLSHIVAKFYFPVELDIDTPNKVAFDVYKPEVSVNNQPIDCTTDYHLGFYSDRIDGGASDIDGENVKSFTKRLRRDTELDNIDNEQFEQLGSPEMLFDLPMNRTVFVNCSTPSIKCMQITCTSGETMNRNQNVQALFSIRAHIDVLQQILNNKDIILLSSTAETNVNGKTTQNFVSTLLIGSLTKEEVSYWIYIVCVIAALIILAIVIFILYKLKFFNRPVREKLQNVSENSSERKNLDDGDDYSQSENGLYQS